MFVLYKPILDLDCRLQIEQVNSGCAESDDGPLALAFLSLRFLSASQILFASNWEAPLSSSLCTELPASFYWTFHITTLHREVDSVYLFQKSLCLEFSATRPSGQNFEAE